MRKTTSLRPPGDLRDRLAVAAEQQGTTLTALVERYAREGLATDAHPGIVFKFGPSGRRAALAGGPDVWKILDALRSTTGPEQGRVATASCTVLLVRKNRWPSEALAARLAESLGRWAHGHPDPGHGAHWLDSAYR
jgi:hypothetical protein